MNSKVYYWVGLICLLLSCTEGKQVENSDITEVDFGPLKKASLSECIHITRFLPLETTDTSLLASIDQLEIVDDRIIILDYHTSNSVSVFSVKDGEMLFRLSGSGNAQGEFLSPYSFWVERSDSSLYVLDRMLSKLIRYRLSDFQYLEEIKLPAISPLAFAILPESSNVLYYYPLRSNDLFGGKQIIMFDKQGNVLSSCYQAPQSGRILHGNPSAFYRCGDKLRVVPYFSDKVCEWNGDSLCVRYHLNWENSRLPDKEIFDVPGSSEVMKKILSEDYIRFLYVYENASCLVVKYYIQKDLYLSVLNKKTDSSFNVKADNVIDDLGIGGHFPLPVGVSDSEELVGILLPQTLDPDKKEALRTVLPSIDGEDNPILVFYTLK